MGIELTFYNGFRRELIDIAALSESREYQSISPSRIDHRFIDFIVDIDPLPTTSFRNAHVTD